MSIAQARRLDLGDDVTAAFPRELGPKTPEEVELVTSGEDGASSGKQWISSATLKADGDEAELHITIWIMGATVDFAFDVFWSLGVEEVKIGELAAHEGAVRSFTYKGRASQRVPPEIEVMLRPSRTIALEELHSWRIWGEEITLRSPSTR